MAIAYDNSTNKSSASNGPHVFAHTCTGVNLVLLVFTPEYTKAVTGGVTYNGVAMTAGGVNSTDSTDAAVNSGFFYLINPATGANNVSVTMSPNSNAQGIIAISYTGVDQTTPIGAKSGPALAHATSVSDDLTTTYANSMVVDAYWQYNDVNGATPGGSQTSRNTGSDVNFPVSWGSSERAAPSITAYNMTWTGFDASNHNLHVLTELVPVQSVASAFRPISIFF